MYLSHDRQADRLILIQEGHPIGAAVILLCAIACFAGGVFSLRDNDAVIWLLAAFLAACGVYLLWHAMGVTETSATFDGAARTLTIRRTRPWRVVSQAVGFDDIFHIEAQARGRWSGHGISPARDSYHGIEIVLAGKRPLWMYESTEQHRIAMARELLAMVRRPASRTA